MAIQFACPECARGYSVKDELAGKSAKCGQCGHKMKIPAATLHAHTAATRLPTPKSAAVKSATPASAAAKPAAAKATGAKTVTANSATKPAAKASAPKSPPTNPDMSSWLDEELKSSRVEVKPKPQQSPSSNNCPSCESPLAEGAVLCVKCGYDTRTRGRRRVQHVDANDSESKPSKLGAAASLLRGTFFSFLGAMLGAIIWAVLAFLTDMQFGIVAWALGGLAGFGMAFGHDDNDGTFAGIIAAFMSLIGIIAAKVFIVVIVIAAVINESAHEFQQELPLDAVEFQRGVLAEVMVLQELKAAGETPDTLDEARLEALHDKAEADVANLSPEEIENRLEAIGDDDSAAGELAGNDEQVAEVEPDFAADDTLDDAEEFDEAASPEEDADFGTLVGLLFRPMDGIFILLAFFTAYKVGSGEIGD